MIKILFVCTGNICRSPMAHYYMQKRIKDLNLQDKYFIDSAGVFAEVGEGATDNAIYAMREYDVDLLPHIAKSIHSLNLNSYDYIFTLTSQHKRYILSYYKEVESKVFTIKEFVGESKNINIDDPWGMNLKVYTECAKQIVENVEKLIKKLEGSE